MYDLSTINPENQTNLEVNANSSRRCLGVKLIITISREYYTGMHQSVNQPPQMTRALAKMDIGTRDLQADFPAPDGPIKSTLSAVKESFDAISE